MTLKNHPFAVKAHFNSSTVLTYCAKKEDLEKLLPKRLTLDTFQDQWGFVAAAMVQTAGLRPAGTPKFLGRNFFLIGFRVFVRYTTKSGKNLRGLYILKSETDKKLMTLFGNLFTHYNYSTTDINIDKMDDTISINSEQSGINTTYRNHPSPALPSKSPFNDWKEARRFSGPLPFTFTYEEEKDEMLIIQGKRTNWNPKPIEVLNHNYSFINSLELDLKLANAFEVKNIPYTWEKGVVEKW